MINYHIKVKKGRKDKPHPCGGYTVTTLPKEGYYAEHPEVIGMPKGQKVKFELTGVPEGGENLILLPRDGQIAFVLDSQGNTIDTYPKKRDRQIRNVEAKEDTTHG